MTGQSGRNVEAEYGWRPAFEGRLTHIPRFRKQRPDFPAIRRLAVAHSRIFTLGVFIPVLLALAVPLAAVEPSQELLPETTKGFMSVANMKDLEDHWNETQIGQLMQDPIMKPFSDDLERQFEGRWGLRDKLGLTMDDIRGVPSGEVAIARLQPGPEQSAVVLLADVTGNLEKAQATIKKAKANLLEQGSKLQTQKIGGLDVDVYDVPKENPDDEEEPQRQAVLLLHGDLLIVADSPDTVAQILERQADSKVKSLADLPAYQAVMARCAEDAGEGNPPQIRWFVEPFGYAEAARSVTPERERRRAKPLTEMLRKTGFDAFAGMGGHVSFAAEGYELIHRTAVHAPPPYEKSMKMFSFPISFPNKADFVPQAWVPRDVATYTTAFVNIRNAFRNLAPLADEYIGEQGAFDDALAGIREDKHGPQVDLEIELIDQLGSQVTVITDFNMPVTTTSERILIAIEVKNEAAVAKAIEKLLEADDTVDRRVLPGREDLQIWETAPPEEKAMDFSLDIMLPGEDALAPEAAEDEEGPKLFPNATYAVTNGQLYISSHLDFLVKLLKDKEREERDTLAAAIDFQVISDKLKELGEERFAGVFSRTDKEYRATYELIRQGKMPESETMFGRVLNTVFGTGKKGVIRKQEVDGSKLPEFDVIRRHLGTAGGFGVSEENGWFVKGFMLSKGAE